MISVPFKISGQDLSTGFKDLIKVIEPTLHEFEIQFPHRVGRQYTWYTTQGLLGFAKQGVAITEDLTKVTELVVARLRNNWSKDSKMRGNKISE